MKQDSTKEISETLIGRAVISVDENVMTLDNGTKLTVNLNDAGCGGCYAGWYELDALNTVENVITAVKVVDDESGRDGKENDAPHTYQIFVYTSGVTQRKDEEQLLLQVSGDDGNGYYGTGYTLTVS